MSLEISTLTQTVTILCNRIESFLAQQVENPKQRVLIALAGVPGSGKSTVCAATLAALALRGINDVVVVPMDGFHYSKAVLSTFEDPGHAFRRRGAPFTFDATAFLKLISTLRATPVSTQNEPETIITAPSFDHAVQDPIPDDIQMSSRNRVVIIEGNYTLLNQRPWDAIAKCVNDTWFVDALPKLVRQRLIQRHIKAGVEASPASAEARVEENDIPNGEFIRANLTTPNVIIMN